MGGLEDVLALHAQRRQVVDVEEPPVIDLVGGHPPVGQAVALPLHQVVEQVEAPRVARPALERGHVLLDEPPHRLALGGQRGQPSLDHLLLALALRDPLEVGLVVLGEVADGGQDALVFEERGVLGAEGPLQLVEAVREDIGVAARGHREAAVVVLDRERPVGEGQLELAGLEDVAVGVAQDREQDLVLELRAGRGPPGDVEVRAVSRGGPVLQHVVPPGVLVRADPHVVGDGVEDLAKPALAQGGDPGLIILLGADLRVEAAVVDDVVAVGAPRPGLEIRRGVGVGDPQVAQVRRDGRGVAEGEAGVELEAVGRFGQPGPGGRLGGLLQQGLGERVRVHGVLLVAVASGKWQVARGGVGPA